MSEGIDDPEPGSWNDVPDEPREPRRPVTVRGAALVSARVVAGLVGIAVAVATVAGAALLPLPVIRSTPPSLVVVPVPTAQQLVCPGSVLRLADDSGQQATTASALGRPLVHYAASEGDTEAAPFAQSDAATGGTAAAPLLVSTPPSDTGDAEPPLLSGAQSQQLEDGDFVGLAAADCGVAAGDAWLVGGSTAVGRTTLLTLSNPSEVSATVDLELFGDRGPVVAPGTSGIVVAPRGQRVLSLAGFQPDLASPVVHVVSTGGQVLANLQQSVVRGLVPGGLDVVGPSALSTENVIPGVVLSGTEEVQALLGGGPAFEDVRTVLRLFTPAEGGVATTVSVIPEDGAQTGTSFELEIDGGRVTDIPIDDLAAGSYTVRVDSEVPVVAAVRVTAASGEATDFAWAVAAPPLESRAQLTVAAGPEPVLHLANPTTAEAVVSVGDQTVTIAPGATAAVPVDPGATIVLAGFERLFAAVSFASGGMAAHHTVHPPGVASGPITIYP